MAKPNRLTDIFDEKNDLAILGGTTNNLNKFTARKILILQLVGIHLFFVLAAYKLVFVQPIIPTHYQIKEKEKSFGL